MTAIADTLIAKWNKAAAPPPKLTVSQWADRTRMLPETSGARGARWRNEVAPYLVGIMDAVHEPGVKKIALMKAAQCGGPLTLETPIPTVSGWTTMGEIQVGDTIFDESGEPTDVVAASETFRGRQCYRVEFSDGSAIVADGEHRWFVESDLAIVRGLPGFFPDLRYRTRGRIPAKHQRDYSGVLTTSEIAASVHRRDSRANRYAIPTTKPLCLPHADLPVDPYVLGVWLGDGHSYSAQITQHENDAPELMRHLEQTGLQPTIVSRKREVPESVTIALERVSSRNDICIRGHQLEVTGRTKRGHCAECHRQQSRKSQYGSEMDPIVAKREGIAIRLAELGLLKTGTRKRAGNRKRIPPQYLRASIRQRLSLLQGLMDTDGSCTTKGRCQYSTTEDELRDGMIELLCSLGLKPYTRRAKGRIKESKSGRTYQCRDYWKIDFTAYSDMPVFRLSRKAKRQPPRESSRTTETERRRIVAVEEVESVPVRCISVSSKRRLFLAGQTMIPTHNSESLHNILGYFIEYDACPILLVHPTAHVAEEWSKERLADMIRTTPALRAAVRDRREPRGSHQGESTLSLKIFPGGYLALGGANTPNTFARRAVRLAMGDDVDRFPPVVGEEGDPADLLVNRTTTFHDALVVLVSTPTLKNGRIDTLYSRSDQRRFLVACPNCGREDWITWNDPAHFRVTYDGDDPETACIECPSSEHGGCAARMAEPERRRMIELASERPGKGWKATAVGQEAGFVGFHLPGMISTLGVSLPMLVEKWLSARSRGKESLRVFINTVLAEGWEDRGARMDAHVLMNRRESYGEGIEVPKEAPALTAGVDVQVDRFELKVIAWGPAGERWVVDWRSIPGDPKRPETHAALLEALGRRYTHASGHLLPIHATCIDSGYATEEIYSFVLAHQARRIFATKGIAGRSGEPIVGKPSEKRYGRAPRPVRLYPINVDDAKADIMSSISLAEAGPGYMHFPILDAIDEEFFAQLCAEHRETRYNKSGVATHMIWVQDRERNEALDCSVLALAAFRLLNPNIRQMSEALAASPSPSSEKDPQEGGGAPPAPASGRGRRVARSKYLGR